MYAISPERTVFVRGTGVLPTMGENSWNVAVRYRRLVPRTRTTALSDEDLRQIYARSRTIAVVGASDRPGKPAHDIPRYLQEQGYHIVPVNPRGGEILGERAFKSLREVDVPFDIVEVFRPAEEAESVAREALASGARMVWFQPGTHADPAVRALTDEGVTVVTDRCMGTAHRELGLGPGPDD